MMAGSPRSGIDDLVDKVAAGQRLSIEEGLRLFDHANLPELAALATVARGALLPEKVVTYAAGIRLSWEDASTLPEEAQEKIDLLAEAEGTGIVVSGNVPEGWNLDTVLQTVRSLKQRAGTLDVLVLSPIEISRLASQADTGIIPAMEALKSAGLDRLAAWSLQYPPAEGEGPSSAAIVGPGLKSPLLASLQAALDADIPVTCQVRLSPSHSPAARMDQILYVRELQEKSGAFMTVTPLNVDPSGESSGAAFDYLRTVAITRLMADNVTHVRASYETQGLKIAQMALEYGADDFGLITLERTASGGMEFAVPIPELERNIREAGFIPQCRNARYEARPTPHLSVPAEPISLQLPAE